MYNYLENGKSKNNLKQERENQIKKSSIELEKDKLIFNKINNIRKTYRDINDNFKNLLDLISSTSKGPYLNRLYDEIITENATCLSNIDKEIDRQRSLIEKKTKDLENNKNQKEQNK